MLRRLRDRECGSLAKTPVLFETMEADRRATSLDLAKYKGFEPVHRTPVVCGSVDPTECRYFISGGVDGTVAIHDVSDSVHPDGEIFSSYKSVLVVDKRSKPDVAHAYSVETASWYPFDTGMFLTSGCDKTLKIWDANAVTPVDEFHFSTTVNDHDVSSVAGNSCLIAVATSSSRIKLVDMKTGSASHILKGHEGPVLSLNWSPRDQYRLASASQDRRILIWDIRRAKSVLFCLDLSSGEDNWKRRASTNAHAHRGCVKCVRFTPDGHHILSLGVDAAMRLWDARSGRLDRAAFFGDVPQINNDRKSSMVILDAGLRSAVFCPSGDDIRVFDVYTGAKLSPGQEAGIDAGLRGHFQCVNFVALHPWYHELYSGGNDRNLVVWTSAASDREPSFMEHMERQTRLNVEQEDEDPKKSGVEAYSDTWSDYSDDDLN